jgi:ABC-type multidrug transport system ATPase subunit
MKQRVKLAQAIFSNTVILLLDEPCSNLDVQGIELYHSLINDYCKERLVIVSSNDEVEYKFTNERISILDYK